MPAHPPTPVEELERRREGERLRRAIDALGESPRTVFILFELEGLSGEQIAELTGLKIDTIWVQLHRARARIRKRLAKEDRRG
jgi:RNA polymerase sigma-70 factor (ECF subfamily)